MTETGKTTKTHEDIDNGSVQHRVGEAAGGMVGVMETARGVAQNMAQNVANQLPSAADTARSAVDQASQQMQTSSDEMLMVGAALTFGVTFGLFISGSNRLAVALALVPAVAMGATLLDRRSRQSQPMG